VVVGAALLLASCGYRVGTRADLLPAKIQTIAVPAFDNLTNNYKLSERLPGAISREFLSRTRYRIVPEEGGADAVLRGSVVNVMTFSSVSDPNSGRSTGMQVNVMLQVSLTDRQSGAVLFSRPNLQYTQRYEISVDQQAYFEESDIALDRLSRDVARSLVSSILEAF
jgi:hypothetical protein